MSERMWCVPMAVGYIPVTMPERVGAQTGECEKALRKVTPSRARRAMLGVLA